MQIQITSEMLDTAFARIYSGSYTPNEITEMIEQQAPIALFEQNDFTIEDMIGYEIEAN